MDLVYENPPGVLTSLHIDAAITETPETTSEPTEYPVGTTRTGTDHIKQNPDTLVVEGVISNTPLAALSPAELGMDGVTGQAGTVGRATVLTFSGAFDRVRAVEAEFRRLQKSGTFVTIIGELRDYEGYVIRRVSTPRSVNTVKSLPFTLEFKQILVANSETTTVPDPEEPRGRAERSRGAQSAEEADAPTRSFLTALIEG